MIKFKNILKKMSLSKNSNKESLDLDVLRELNFDTKSFIVNTGTKQHNMEQFISNEGTYEPWLVKYFKIASCFYGNDKDALDIGANIGMHSLLLATLQKEGKVIAFEALCAMFETLKKNIDTNNVTNAIPHQVIISDVDHQEMFINIFSDSNIGASFVSSKMDSTIKSEKVSTLTLDTYINKSKYQLDIKIIKIDVEKWEKYVLLGAKETIKKHNPVVFIEFNIDARTIKDQKGGFELYNEIKSLFKYIFIIDRSTHELVPIKSFNELCAAMFTGHFVEDLICFNDESFYTYIQKEITEIAFTCYHASKIERLKNNNGAIHTLLYYPDTWCHGHDFFLTTLNFKPISIKITFSNIGPFESNTILIFYNNEMEEIELIREKISRTYTFCAQSLESIYIFVDKVFLAKDHINPHDPRELGIQIEIKEL